MLKHTEKEIRDALENLYNRGPNLAITDYVVLNNNFGFMRCSPDERTEYSFSKRDGRLVIARHDLLDNSVMDVSEWYHSFFDDVIYPVTIEEYFQISTIQPVLFSNEMFEYILKLLENKYDHP